MLSTKQVYLKAMLRSILWGILFFIVGFTVALVILTITHNAEGDAGLAVVALALYLGSIGNYIGATRWGTKYLENTDQQAVRAYKRLTVIVMLPIGLILIALLIPPISLLHFLIAPAIVTLMLSRVSTQKKTNG